MKTWVQPVGDRVGSHEALAAMLCEVIRPMLDPDVHSQQRGLYLATGDAGIQCAVQFWADALEETPRFASPAGFPWTLANAPASRIARELEIRGPNHTIMGGEEAVSAATGHGASDLKHGRVREAVLVVVNLAAQIQATALVVASAEVNPDTLDAALKAAVQ